MVADDDAGADGTEENDDPDTDGTVVAADGGRRALRGRALQSRALSTTAFQLSACVEFPKNVSCVVCVE